MELSRLGRKTPPTNCAQLRSGVYKLNPGSCMILSQSLTLSDAIQRHAGEAKGVISRFNGLTSQEQQQIITFLRSL
jgi:hypothetical protein